MSQQADQICCSCCLQNLSPTSFPSSHSQHLPSSFQDTLDTITSPHSNPIPQTPVKSRPICPLSVHPSFPPFQPNFISYPPSPFCAPTQQLSDAALATIPPLVSLFHAICLPSHPIFSSFLSYTQPFHKPFTKPTHFAIPLTSNRIFFLISSTVLHFLPS